MARWLPVAAVMLPLLLRVDAAAAAELPVFEAGSQCEQAGRASRMKATLAEECLYSEQRHYRALRRIWHRIPEPLQRRCAAFGRLGDPGRPYTYIYSCIGQALRADRRVRPEDIR